MSKKRFLSGALAAAVLATSFAAPVAAGEWRHGPSGPYYQRGGDRLSPGAAAAIGVLGGLAIGGAIAAANQPPPVNVGPMYAPPAPRPVYVAPPPRRVYVEETPVVVERRCVTERTREWVPGWGWEYRKSRTCY